ncbi:RHS repeat protein [Galbibacter sp. BG1]|uniref:RHS repeat domain-containing protein n=1 Tax=Galbibacter sp. BG1 TaxID=1170699 RepID=UPI0015BEB1EE|nr:RHS repeat domain-containing protein [Galbibacter sp. BG1]QLE02058.1 RHS repeat protein [Galbibacter sp. BG1]
MNSKFFYNLLLVSSIFISRAQDNIQGAQPNVFPPSPNASGIARYDNTKIGYYTGTPEISVPIHKFNTKQLNLVFSMNYLATGIKVNEMAGDKGMHWNLSGVGVVSRIVYGNPDDSPDNYSKGFLYNTDEVPDSYTNYDEFYNLARGHTDTQPDIFNFSLPGGYSGKFAINYDGSIITIPYQNVKIEYERQNGWVTKWIITTPDGVKSTLDVLEKSRNEIVPGSFPNYSNTFFTSSWYVSKIEAPNGEIFEYGYDNTEYNYIESKSEADYHRIGQGQHPATFPGPEEFEHHVFLKAKKILYCKNLNSGEKIKFDYSLPRKDLIGDVALKSIVVINDKNDTIKRFELNYKYQFKQNLLEASQINIPDQRIYRLYLTSILQKSIFGSLIPYNFEYLLQSKGKFLPGRFSYAQDHWGFYNGKDENTTLKPKKVLKYEILNPTQDIVVTLNGGDRSSDSILSTLGTLNKIVYPTKGYSKFEYVSHSHSSDLIEKEIDEKTFSYTVGRDYLSPENSFSIEEGILGKVRVNLTTPGISNLAPETMRIRIHKSGDPSNYFVYDSEFAFNYGSQKYEELQFDVEPNSIYDVSYIGINRGSLGTGVFTLKVNWELEKAPNNYAGGARVTKIESYDPSTDKTLIKEYEYYKENGESSGFLLKPPIYGSVYRGTYYQILYAGSVAETCGAFENVYYVRNTFPYISLTYTQGSSIGYERVLEKFKDGNDGNGHSIYQFSKALDLSSINQYPNVPDDSREWLRGNLLKEEHYKALKQTPERVVDYYYEYPGTMNELNDILHDKIISATRILQVYENNCPRSLVRAEFQFEWSNYRVSTGYRRLATKTETLNFENNSIVSVENYRYSNKHLNLIELNKTGSDGKVVVRKYSYAKDFDDNVNGTDLLRSRFMHDFKVEYEEFKNYKFQTKVTNKYVLNNNHIVLDERTENTKNFSSINQRKFFYTYNDNARIIEYKGQFNPGNSIFWGYKGEYPIAKVENATYVEIAGALGVSVASLEAFNEGNLSQLDNLRELLPKAQVTTYTYEPLVGIKTMTDPRGKTTHYEYDDFNRLKTTKDDNLDLLSDFRYHYKDQ